MAKTNNTLKEFRDVIKAYEFQQDCRDYDNGWRKNIYSPNKSKDRIRKIKTEKLMSQKERENEMKDFKPYRADPTPKNTSAGKTAPPRKAEGGMIDMTKMKYV